MLRRLPPIVALLFSLACSKEGPVGPQGPAGPQGPSGPAGSVNRADFTGTIGASGGISVPLPTAAVANNKVPIVACFISENRQTWLAVAALPPEDGFPFCGLTGIGTGTPNVTLVDAPVGFFYYIIAAW